MKELRIFISAGDPSGDRNCAPLVASIIRNFPTVHCSGLGGPAMEREGFESRFDFARFNKMGYVEVLRELPFFLREKKRFISMLEREKPDLLICADYSGFNTPLMKAAKELDIPVLWFIAPMIWAWKKYKHGPRLGDNASHVAVIFPFEVRYWQEFTQEVTYVGNPLLEEKQLRKRIDRVTSLRENEEIVVACAPGSRPMEIKRMLPEMIRTADLLKKQNKSFHFRVSCTEYLPQELYDDARNAGLELFTGSLTELFQTSDIALVTSGTSTLHAALTGIPLMVLYKSSFLLFAMVKILTKQSEFSHIGLPNIMSPKEIAKEFIQYDMKAEKLAVEILKLVEDESYYQERSNRTNHLLEQFGAKAPSKEIIPIIERLTGCESAQ